ncbi:MAG: M48 family metallopeptidase, partial [Acidiferrobacterales bacterium]|nr:M48 family metallopeptidase [Acidiferrobacterales bacterium]
MTTLRASFYDGKTSAKKDVQLHFYASGELVIRGLEEDLKYSLADVRISTRVGNTPRSLYLPDGAKCETFDNDAVDALLERHRRHRGAAWLHRFESKLRYVALAVVVTVVVAWGFIQYGIPLLAKHVADALPASVDTALGKEGLAVMDRLFFAPSELREPRRRELQAIFSDMAKASTDDHEFKLIFRKSPRVGANAFALPSGIVVITDELVALVRDDNELIAVLAHEIGHVVHRHALRRVLQDSTVVLVIAAVTGDVTSITSLAATIPVVLVEAKYSRDFEREADDYALSYLRAN